MVGAFVAFCFKLPALKRSYRDAALIALTVYLFCSGLSFLLGLDAVWPVIARMFGYVNITTILIHATVVVLTMAQQIVLVHWSNEPEDARKIVKRRMLLLGVLLIVLVNTFIWAMPSRRYGAETASLLNMHNPRYAIYMCLYITVIAAGQAITMCLSLRYAKLVGRRWTRLGLLIVATGAAAILVYCVVRYVEVVGVQLGVDMAPLDPVQWIAGDVGSLLELIGWTIPAWGPALTTRRKWFTRYRAYQRLHPLWEALYKATPTILSGGSNSRLADLLIIWDLEHRLYRRVIEIRDGQLALRPYLSPAIADTAKRYGESAGITGERQQAVVEAFQLHLAISAKKNQVPPSTEPATLNDAYGDSFSSEVRWLTSVADAFLHFSSTPYSKKLNDVGRKSPQRV